MSAADPKATYPRQLLLMAALHRSCLLIASNRSISLPHFLQKNPSVRCGGQNLTLNSDGTNCREYWLICLLASHRTHEPMALARKVHSDNLNLAGEVSSPKVNFAANKVHYRTDPGNPAQIAVDQQPKFARHLGKHRTAPHHLAIPLGHVAWHERKPRALLCRKVSSAQRGHDQSCVRAGRMARQPLVGSRVRQRFIKPDPSMVRGQIARADPGKIVLGGINREADRRQLAADQVRFRRGGCPQRKIGIAAGEIRHLRGSDKFETDGRILRGEVRHQLQQQRQQGVGGGQPHCAGRAQVFAGQAPFQRDDAAIHLLRKSDDRIASRGGRIAFALAIKQAHAELVLGLRNPAEHGAVIDIKHAGSARETARLADRQHEQQIIPGELSVHFCKETLR